jgi:CubicO group peptidase (beta-lactamase class C family)
MFAPDPRQHRRCQAGNPPIGLSEFSKPSLRLNGSLSSLATFGHAGAGGSYVWVDPTQELIGVYLSVGTRMIRNQFIDTNVDLFQNAIHAAIVS